MNSILNLIDASLCLLVVIAAGEYLRQINPLEHPLLSASFYMVAIGAFGIVLKLLAGHAASPWDVLLHTGIVMYAWARRHHIFVTGWNGHNRRKTVGKHR